MPQQWEQIVKHTDAFAENNVTGDERHDISCLQSIKRFSRTSNLIAHFKQSFASNHNSSVCFRATTLPQDRSEATRWFNDRPMGRCRQLLWYVTVVDTVDPSRKSAGSVCSLGTA